MTIRNLFKKIPQTPKKTYGTHGRIEIPDLNIGIPLYLTEDKNAQKIVDDQDSAACICFGEQNIIVDHVSQGLSNLINVKPGVTKAYIQYEDGSHESYICECSQLGHIKKSSSGNQLFDWTWKHALGKNKNCLTIYTCLGRADGDDQLVTLTYWSLQ